MSKVTARTRKIFILALDGATFDLLDPWMRAGELPHLAQFKREAAYGPLRSTVPPITGAAWTTFQTGVNPGKHGIFDWLVREPGSYRLVPIGTHLFPQRTIWEWCSRGGLRVGALGVPVTYPPRPVNGFIVSGLLAPEGADYTYPVALRAELEAAVPGYTTMPEHWRGRYRARAWLEGLKASLERRLAAARYLLKKPWDLFMVHLMETDSVQHQMWHLLDGIERPRYRTPGVAGNPILEIYRKVDAALPELLREVPPEAAVILVSDHGFGPLFWNVYLNSWLLQRGYLVLKRGVGALLKRGAFFGLGLTQENLYPLADRLGLLSRGARLRHGQIYELMGRLFLSHRQIDWRRTRAYSFGNIGQITLNLQGREPQGCVRRAQVEPLLRELTRGLEAFKNPYTGERVIRRVIRKEALYRGPALDRAPELILEPADGTMVVGTSEFLSRRALGPCFAGSGWHRMEGILMARGEGVRPGKLQDMEIVDLCPTLLEALDLPVPEGLDGRVIEGLLDLDRPRPRTPRGRRAQIQTPAKAKASADEDGHLASGAGEPLPDSDSDSDDYELPEGYEEEILRRLQGMGYL